MAKPNILFGLGKHLQCDATRAAARVHERLEHTRVGPLSQQVWQLLLSLPSNHHACKLLEIDRPATVEVSTHDERVERCIGELDAKITHDEAHVLR